MTDFIPTDTHDGPADAPRRPQALARRGRMAATAAGLLALGGVAGAVAVHETRPTVTMAPATPVAIRAMSGGITTIRGRVAEVYGKKFVLADASGRALIDTGREGEDGRLVAPGQAVTVQGRYERGFVHAAFLVGADGKVRALGPLDGPPHGHHGPPHGPGGRDDAGAPPPPPPPPGGPETAFAPPPPPPPGAGRTGVAPLPPAPARGAPTPVAPGA